jgi:TetR/AcrR family transcriptional regulator, regulator of autoinduction and epiphytic fitness
MDGNESARQTHALEIALTVFARHGFRKTSIEDIAKAAGISRQGIYLHFKNKEWFGRHVGLLDPEASDLVAQCERVLGDAVGKSRSSFQKKLEKVILARSARKTKGADKRAATIADMLCACGMTWKRSFSSRQEFLKKMCDAIHLCCRDL